MSLPSRRSPPDRKINFTKKAIEDLPLPTDAPKVRYHDTKTSCLGLMVYSSGRKVYIFYRKVEGRPEQMTIGRFPDMTIEQARGRVDELNSKVARGINPGQESRALREEMTLGELFDKYLEEYAKVHKKSWKSDEYQFELYLESWKNRKLRSIRREDIQALHGRVGKSSGPYAANRLLALLSTMFTKAIVEWKWNHPHPAKGIRKFREHSRDRFLQGEELGRFFAALGVEEDVAARDLFLLLLLTGARRENVMSMRWEDVDLESKVWRIPETKSGSPQHVPLVPEAVRILVERRDHPERTRVFPLGDRYHPAVWRRILVQMSGNPPASSTRISRRIWKGRPGSCASRPGSSGVCHCWGRSWTGSTRWRSC